MPLEVAARGLKLFFLLQAKDTTGYSQKNAFCTKIMSIVINLCTVCKALFGISMHKGLKQKIGLWQLLDSMQSFELLAHNT